jgi:DNA-binding response OmpR family regulator
VRDHAKPESTRRRADLDDAPIVLIVDDDPAVLDSLATVIEEQGFHVLTARDGREGLRVFRRASVAAAVIDIIMPEQDGIGTILQMRRERPDLKIIAISGGGYFDTADYLTVAGQLGADEAFRKTLDPMDIVAALRRLLGATTA